MQLLLKENDTIAKTLKTPERAVKKSSSGVFLRQRLSVKFQLQSIILQ